MTTATADPGAVLRPHAEQEHRAELAALAAADDRPRPPGWRLSPWAVTTYLLGGTADGTEITPKYIGSRRLVEVAVATLATDRALLLLGVPGTAKTWLSEHLAAAISGDSTLMVQGTAGTAEEAVRYGWNYARLIAEGPSREAMVPSPVMRAMSGGTIARVEELTRMPSDVQDALITILSEKTLPIPELGGELQAIGGFNVIATANDRDRGVNELSSALRRRFNTVVLPVPASAEEEVEIVTRRVAQLGRSIGLPQTSPGADEIRRVVTVFRELRQGVTEDGRAKVKSPSGTLSPAEAISVVTSGLALAAHFGDGVLRPADVAGGITGAVIQDPVSDRVVWQEYLETVVRGRDDWDDFYRACRGHHTPFGKKILIKLFGVRHHGPGSARPLRDALAELGPDIVLIEGPPEADGLVELAGDPQMRPPVALLAYVPGQPKTAAFWPFAVFSPEWQAIGYALGADVPVRFCDLPAAHQLALAGRDAEPRDDPIGDLARAGGYDDPERWWEDVVEHVPGPSSVFEAIAEAIAVLRADADEPDPRDAIREAHMRKTLRKAVRDGYQRIAVVCGAWHVPALQRLPS